MDKMGVLYNSAMMKKRWKRQYIIDELAKLGVTHTKEGQPIQSIESYDLLKEQLVLALFRHIDIENDNGSWF